MTDIFKDKDATELAEMIEYVVTNDNSGSTVGDIRQHLGLTQDEFSELYDLCMPTIRQLNEARFWRSGYSKLESAINLTLSKPMKRLRDKLAAIKDIMKQNSSRALKKERLEEMNAA